MLHACAHNPTGCDPSTSQWNELSDLAKQKNLIIFFDCAYQGFASGNSESDAYSIRKFVADGHHIILSQSFAKNFGLYGERVGTLSVVCSSSEEAGRVTSQLRALVRPMYSNPPIHGVCCLHLTCNTHQYLPLDVHKFQARIVAEVLKDEKLKKQWANECRGMADRIITMRYLMTKPIICSSHSIYY